MIVMPMLITSYRTEIIENTFVNDDYRTDSQENMGRLVSVSREYNSQEEELRIFQQRKFIKRLDSLRNKADVKR